MGTKTQTLANALTWLPINCSIGCYQLEKGGEIRVAWRVIHHFTDEILSDELTADEALRKGAEVYQRKQLEG